MNIWSYSIFGRDTDKYYKPMIENFKLAKSNNARIIINVNKDDEQFVKDYFEDHKDKFILEVHNDFYLSNFPKMLRYIISKKYLNDNFFYKDSDSIVTDDEINIMKNWLENENTDYLIIRNHPVHLSPILAGMFGVKYSKLGFLINLVEKFFNEKYLKENNIKFTDFDYDQVFLQIEVYSKILKHASIYSSHFYFCEENIIQIRFNKDFIGRQVYRYKPEIGNEWYFKLYNNKMLVVPYVHRLYKYYKSDKTIILLAKIFTLLSLKRFCKK